MPWQPRSTLFPYTTLFRSCSSPARRCMTRRRRRRCSKWWQKARSEEHTSELQSREKLVCRLLLEKKKKQDKMVRLSVIYGRDVLAATMILHNERVGIRRAR